ncbi:MAG: SDR family NAD(P)-dependent oxidoreductase [Chromatiales bacterium]|jgi:NAD(P)-dependent dehydrogenase (short-subunit alcohol dehydrogenase family)|nr:SDR family NAD(P)-dependent oxidoreductase [Chromatiales bacterium]
MHLEGRTAIVTGAGRGIGKEIALELGRHGANVVVNDLGADRGGAGTDTTPADEVVSEIEAGGAKAMAAYGSVSDYAEVGRMVANTVEQYGSLDIVVNVAGMLRERMVWNMTEDDWDSVVSVHLKGHFNLCHHASKVMRTARHGRIINFSSDAFKGSVGQCNYSAAKAGIIGLTRSLARELGRYGVTANAMCPLAATRMTVDDKVIDGMKRRLDNGLISQAQYDNFMAMPGPEFVAPMVAYLATDAAADVNGQVFHAERGRIHTYYYGEEARSIHKQTDGGMFTVDELLGWVPGTLMSGIPNVAPKQDPKP